MDMTECAWCSIEIENGGIPHKSVRFCSQECLDDWDEDALTEEDIDLDGLDGLNGSVVEDDNFGLSEDEDAGLLLSEDDF